MPRVTTEYISIGCNRTTHAAAWGVSGLVAFAASKLVALYDPLDKAHRGVQETLPGHTERVICVEFIEQGCPPQDVALVSGSADTTAKIWKKNKDGEWINSATLQGHSGAVEAIGVMRTLKYVDGPDLIATGSADGTIRIWERKVVDDTHDEISMLQIIECGNKYPTALVMSYLPGSHIPVLACAHTDKKISVYIYQNSVKQFKKAHVLQGHDNWVRSLAFATYTGDDEEATGTNHTLRHGDLMLASGSQDKYIRLWKISPHKEAPKQPKENNNDDNNNNGITDDLLQALQESALTGENVLSTRAHIVDVDDEADPSRKVQYSLMFEALLMGHDDWVFSVCWERPRQRKDDSGAVSYIQPMRLLSASSDKSMMIWRPDPSTGVWVNEVRMGDIGGNSYLGFQGALFAPDGSHVLAHGANGSFHLWKNVSKEDEETGRWAPQVAVSGHFKPVQNVAWDPKSRYLLSASLDQTTRLHAPWVQDIEGEKVTTWHEMGRPQIHGYDLKCLSFVHEWQFVSGADEKVLRVFDGPQSCVKSLAKLMGQEEISPEISNRPVAANVPALGLSNKAVFEGDIQEMENAEEDHTMLQSYTHNASTPASLTEVMDHPPFEEHLLQHTLWPEVEKLYGHGYEIISVEASHDGKYVASACKAATPEHAVVRIFETGNWKELPGKVAGHTLTVTRARFSHNDRWLLTVSRDRMWCLSERKEDDHDAPYQIVAKNKAHARIIWDCSWSHDDRFFATGSRDKSIKIWTQKQDAVEWVCTATVKCAEAVTSVEFAPVPVDGRYVLAVGLEDGQILLLGAKQEDVSRWEVWLKVEKRLCHVGVVNSFSWRAQPLQLASAGDDNAVRILNVHI